jgi:hypothetical protein
MNDQTQTLESIDDNGLASVHGGVRPDDGGCIPMPFPIPLPFPGGGEEPSIFDTFPW